MYKQITPVRCWFKVKVNNFFNIYLYRYIQVFVHNIFFMIVYFIYNDILKSSFICTDMIKSEVHITLSLSLSVNSSILIDIRYLEGVLNPGVFFTSPNH